MKASGSKIINNVGNALRNPKKTYTSFKFYVAERTKEIRGVVKRELCNTANKALAWWKDNGPSVLRVTGDLYDDFPEEVRELVEGGANVINDIGKATIGKNLINKITDNNQLEKELVDKFGEPLSRYLAFKYNEEKDYYYTNDEQTIQKLSGFTNLFDDIGGMLGTDSGYSKEQLRQESVLYIDDTALREELYSKIKASVLDARKEGDNKLIVKYE